MRFLCGCSDLGQTFSSLGLLDMFGVVHASHAAALQKELPRICINAKPFSGVARPTPAARPADDAMWDRRCRLRFKP